MAPLPCRLVHGPFDGDEGYISGPPRSIYAMDCPGNHGRVKGKKRECDQNGVHWTGDPKPEMLRELKTTAERLGLRLERYKKDVELNGVRLYVWADVKGQPRIKDAVRKKEPVAA